MKATTRKKSTAEQRLSPSEIIVSPIAPAMSKEQACAMFAQEAILFGKRNGIPLYRVCELFGGWVRPWFEATRTPYRSCVDGKETAYMCPGVDWNAAGDVGEMVCYLYESGFFKVVSRNNTEVVYQREKESASALEG